jgi:tellurite resistance protein TehA-like permease
MDFFNFSFPPLFFSVMAYCFFLRKARNKVLKKKKHVLVILMISIIICFAYPFGNTALNINYQYFDNFVLFCFLTSLLAVLANLAVYFFYYRSSP